MTAPRKPRARRLSRGAQVVLGGVALGAVAAAAIHYLQAPQPGGGQLRNSPADRNKTQEAAFQLMSRLDERTAPVAVPIFNCAPGPVEPPFFVELLFNTNSGTLDLGQPNRMYRREAKIDGQATGYSASRSQQNRFLLQDSLAIELSSFWGTQGIRAPFIPRQGDAWTAEKQQKKEEVCYVLQRVRSLLHETSAFDRRAARTLLFLYADIMLAAASETLEARVHLADMLLSHLSPRARSGLLSLPSLQVLPLCPLAKMPVDVTKTAAVDVSDSIEVIKNSVRTGDTARVSALKTWYLMLGGELELWTAHFRVR